MFYIKRDKYERVGGDDLSATGEGMESLIHEFTHVIHHAQHGYAAFGRRYAAELRQHDYEPNKLYDYRSRNNDYAHETLEGRA